MKSPLLLRGTGAQNGLNSILVKNPTPYISYLQANFYGPNFPVWKQKILLALIVKRIRVGNSMVSGAFWKNMHEWGFKRRLKLNEFKRLVQFKCLAKIQECMYRETFPCMLLS